MRRIRSLAARFSSSVRVLRVRGHAASPDGMNVTREAMPFRSFGGFWWRKNGLIAVVGGDGATERAPSR